jgi:hypothetical protein
MQADKSTLGEPAYVKAFKYWKQKIKKAQIVVTIFFYLIKNHTFSIPDL